MSMNFFDPHFTFFQSSSFFLLVLTGAFSVFLFLNGKMKFSLVALFIAALMLRFTMATIDPFLNLWDEQYHALVAKNMMQHPFTPMLVTNPVLPYYFENWSKNHIWLHKQPLFLWQMALSMKLFGVNEFAVRLPSAIMSALCVLLIFRMGKLLMNEKVGWYAAFLFAFSNFQLEFALGRINTDHNDLAFMFYVTASIWAWLEYEHSKKIKWIILTGVFSGMAVLVKWLTGLLVFGGWTLALLFVKEERSKWKNYRNILFSFFIALAVFLPWQIYKSMMFPIESAIEYKFYALHFTIPLDGHDGPWWYHFEKQGVKFVFDGAFDR